MARFFEAGIWICNFCERKLPESEFAADNWRRERGKGPGRCVQCEKELARAKTAFSPTGRYGQADHCYAYEAAKETCRAHAWGSGYYSRTDKADANERGLRIKELRGAERATAKAKTGMNRTFSERRADEDELKRTADERRARRERKLNDRVLQRAAVPLVENKEVLAAISEEEAAEKEARKQAIRERRAARRRYG